MLIDWIVQNALTILFYVIGLFIVVKCLTIIFMLGFADFFWLLLGSMGIVNSHEIKNTFDEGLKRYLIVSNRINTVFYWVAGANLFIYLFTFLLFDHSRM